MKSHEELRALRIRNMVEGWYGYEGFSSEEIAAYNRILMFGENDQAFPSPSEWSKIVD